MVSSELLEHNFSILRTKVSLLAIQLQKITKRLVAFSYRTGQYWARRLGFMCYLAHNYFHIPLSSRSKSKKPWTLVLHYDKPRAWVDPLRLWLPVVTMYHLVRKMVTASYHLVRKTCTF